VAQLVSPGGPGPSGVLTVADLLSRNAPLPVKILGSQTAPPVSVGSLLRREGLDDAPVASRRAALRGGAIAAGTLLAAGSVYGAVLLADHSVPEQTPLAGPDPRPALLDTPAAPAATAPVVPVDRAAATTGGLDAGTGAPTTWSDVAFPRPAATSTTDTGSRTPIGMRSPAAPEAPAAPAPSPRVDTRAAPAATSGASDGTSDQQPTAEEAAHTGSTASRPTTTGSSISTPERAGGLLDTVLGAVTGTGHGLLGLG
jgi:hypothetical protein